jgi:starch synthase
VRILFLAAEAAPYAKVGGLGDVVGALPKALHQIGHDVRVVIPRQPQTEADHNVSQPLLGGATFPVPGSDAPFGLGTAHDSDVPVYFVEHEGYFGRQQAYGYPDDVERFLYFSRAALEVPQLVDWEPEVVHCHDWHTAIIPHLMRHARSALPPVLRNAASIMTIHNLGFQGGFDPPIYRPEWIEPSRLIFHPTRSYTLLTQGIVSADLVTTVSERYAHEITTPEYGEGLDDVLTRRQNELRGIVNGIDYDVYDPATDPNIAAHYSAADLHGKRLCKEALQLELGFDIGARRPLIGLVGRLFDQKGFDLVAEALERILAEIDVQVVILGTGEPHHEEVMRRLGSRNRRQLAVSLRFDPGLAQRIYAGADLFLMPSRYEPCGLAQMIALRYGTVPVVRATGGLADTVLDYQGATGRGTGFVFKRYDAISLVLALGRALEVYRSPERWENVQQQGMRQDFSWAASAHRYVVAYGEALAYHSRDAEASSRAT